MSPPLEITTAAKPMSPDPATAHDLRELIFDPQREQPVRRGQRTGHREFSNGKSLLSMEQSAHEVVWSSGSPIASEAVAAAFSMSGRKDLFKRGDAGPTTPAGSGTGCGCSGSHLPLVQYTIGIGVPQYRCRLTPQSFRRYVTVGVPNPFAFAKAAIFS